MQALKSLTGLRHLRLHITHKEEAQRYKHIKDKFFDSMPRGEPMRKLSTLRLTSAEVHVRLPRTQLRSNSWTDSDMKEVADMLRKMLLNPEGAELYAKHIEEIKKRILG